MIIIRKKLKKHRFAGKLGLLREDMQAETVYPSRTFLYDRPLWNEKPVEPYGRLLCHGEIFMIIGDQHRKDLRVRNRGHRKNCMCGSCYNRGDGSWCSILLPSGEIGYIPASSLRVYGKT